MLTNRHIIDPRAVLSDEARAYVAVFGLLNRDRTPSTAGDVEAYMMIGARAENLVRRDLAALDVCL